MSARFDTIIRGAQVYDGTGGPSYTADVALCGDRIGAVGQRDGEAATILDASGLAVAPGFIDVHSHDDFAVFSLPTMDCKVMQGVTTDVVGNCGLGAAPFEPAARLFRGLAAGARERRWEGYGGYLRAIDAEPPSLNVAALVGHATLRLAAMGNARRPPTADELARMRAWLREALDAGAVGLSTGLIYEPGCFAATAEIVALARELAASGALYATHMRNEADGLLDAVRETLQIGAAAGTAVQISHHKAAGKDNWGRVRDSLRLIEEANASGLDATADQYPYTSGSTSLLAVVQTGALRESGPYGGLGRVEAGDVWLASAPRHREYEGKTLAELCRRFALPAEAAAQRVINEEGAGAIAVIEMMDEGDVRSVLRHPTTMIGSDGLPTLGGKPHPRLYGTFPRVLGRYARDSGLLSLEEAVYRMTGFPAGKFKLAGRGCIRTGAFADLVVFDPATIIDTATAASPHGFPRGIAHVFVNGVAVVQEGRHTGARPGRALRRG